jgi:hypothetical protein
VAKRSPLTTCTYTAGRENGRAVVYYPYLTAAIGLGCVWGVLRALLYSRAGIVSH